MKRVVFGVGIVAMLLVAGCWPERVVWSPDGQYAAVIGGEGDDGWGDGLYLCDAQGNLSAPAPTEGDIIAVDWFPDSERCVAVVSGKLRTWAEIEPLLSEEEKERLVSLSEAFRQDILASYEGDLGRLQSVKGFDSETLLTMKIYLRDHKDAKLVEKLGERWKEFEEASCEGWLLQVLAVKEGGLNVGAMVARSSDEIVTVRVSPEGKAVAYTRGKPDKWHEEGLALYVAAADGSGREELVADFVGMYPDWSANGQELVYEACESAPLADDAGLGTIVMRRVCGSDGGMLEEFQGTRELAGVVFDVLGSKVRCLQDGRILFSSYEVHLPTTDQDMPERASLFAVDPERQATVTRVLPRSAEAQVGGMTGLFEVSPDGDKVAIVGEKGKVWVVTLATGEVLTVQPDEEKVSGDVEFRTVPKWRSADELCFAVPPGSPHGSPDRAEIVLWSPKGYRCISKDWPESVTRGFLD